MARLILPSALERMQTLTAAGTIMGTVSYMSPEQAEDRMVDSRSDIFSFGAVLYEMVCGARAFERDSSISTLAAVLHQEPPVLPNAPPDLAAIINRRPVILDRALGGRFGLVGQGNDGPSGR